MATTAMSKIPSPGEAIRGPRRVRTTSVPPEPSVEVLPEIAAESRAALARPRTDPSRVVTTAKLPRASHVSSPDARVTPHQAMRAVDITLSSRRGSPVRRAMWFSAGILLGAVALSAIRGDMHGARMWAANALRSLERNPPPAQVATNVDEKAAAEAPCTAEDCAILMAPFQPKHTKSKAKPAVSTVSVEDLPRAPAPVVYVPPPAPKPAETADTLAAAATATASATTTAAPSAPPTATSLLAALEAAMSPPLSPATAAPAPSPALSAPAVPATTPAPPSTVPQPPPTGSPSAAPSTPSAPAATSETPGKTTVAENE